MHAGCIDYYLWTAIDVDPGEVWRCTPQGRSLARAMTFLGRAPAACEGKPVIVVDRAPWYPWALRSLGIQYIHETFGDRNRMEKVVQEA